MKRYFSTLILLCLALFARAQVFYTDGSSDLFSSNARTDLQRKKLIDAHVMGLKVYLYEADSLRAGKKDNGYLAQDLSYDKNGNLTRWYIKNKRGRIVNHYNYLYNDKNEYLQFTEFKRNGRVKFLMDNSFDNEGNCIETWRYYNDAPPSHVIQKFGTDHKLLESVYKFKNDRKFSGRYVFSYYDDGRKKQTLEYDEKGKVIHTWNYDCSSVGKLASLHVKDTNKVCTRYEKDINGNPIKVKEEFQKDGPIRRTIEKYDIHDNMIEEEWYNARGIIISHWASVFNDKSEIVEYLKYKRGSDKLAERYTYMHNEDGLISEVHSFSKDNKPKHITKYIYTKNL